MNKNHSRGFTLVEILIALMIFSIIMVALFSSFRAFIVSSQAVKEELAWNEKIQNTFKRISMDLEAVYVVQPPRYQKPEFNTDPDPHGFIGHEQTIGQEPAAFMRFSSLAHVAIGSDQRAGVARIAYYVKENNTHTYDLYRSDTLPPFPQDPKSCTDPVLCKNIKGFEVLYTDHNGDDHKYWDSDSEEFNHTVPAGIHLTLRCGSDEKSRAFDFSVDLAAGREPVE